MPSQRVFISGCSLGDQIFVIGGSTEWRGALPNDYLKLNEVYTPGQNQIGVNPQGKLSIAWPFLRILQENI